MNAEAQKRAAAARALEFVRPGMKLGLGTGSTAKHFVELLGEKLKTGLRVVGVPTSEATRKDAERCGVPLTTLDKTPALDLTVDGADEISPDSCRLWDIKTRNKLDKDRFRQDLGGVVESYREVAQRLGILVETDNALTTGPRLVQ